MKYANTHTKKNANVVRFGLERKIGHILTKAGDDPDCASVNFCPYKEMIKENLSSHFKTCLMDTLFSSGILPDFATVFMF